MMLQAIHISNRNSETPPMKRMVRTSKDKEQNEISNKPFSCLQSKLPIRAR